MDELENWLRRAAPGDGVSLDRLEDDVWSRVRVIQAQRATDRIRMAAVAVALGSAPILAGLLEWALTRRMPTTTWMAATALARHISVALWEAVKTASWKARSARIVASA